ncbi:MAG: hypothetical protein ACUVRH_04645 [Candidatus Bipolaricaulia bacterium]
MGFTIEVRKRGKYEEFHFSDLLGDARAVHHECYEGKAEVVKGSTPRGWIVRCLRCGQEAALEVGEKEALDLVQTAAIDGKERQLAKQDEQGIDIWVIQRGRI